MWRGLLLLLLQGHLVAGQVDTCRYAHDGECDDPRVGTGACPLGTDWTDCKNSCRFAHDGECDEPLNCRTGTDDRDCASRSTSSSPPPPPPPGPPDEDGLEEFEEEERETMDMQGWQLLLQLTVLLVFLFFPCIVFGCAYCSCIRLYNEIGASPDHRT